MYATMILGAGPGGTGPLVWAAQNGRLDAWLAARLVIVDQQTAFGGTLGRYHINSDSLGTAYLECLDAPAARRLFAPLRDDPVTQALEPMRYGFPPLSLVDRYLGRLGAVIADAIDRKPGCDILSESAIRALHLRPDGAIAADVATQGGRPHRVEARTAILALGGRQAPHTYLDATLLDDIRLSHYDADKILPSDAVLAKEGPARVAARLDRVPGGKVVVLGGSHSAFSVAWALARALPPDTFSPGQIVILARRHPPIFYESAEHAAADGYAVTEADICPRTRRVNRLGGLRGDGREMWRSLTGRPGTEADPRIVLKPLTGPDSSPTMLRQLLDEAAVIVPAFGYRARTVPVFDARGRRLRLNAELGGASVDGEARILLADGTVIPNLFGLGLGSGFVPPGSMGGEASFRGQANSLWLYQNDIGGTVFRGVQHCLERMVAGRGRSLDAAAGVVGEPVPAN